MIPLLFKTTRFSCNRNLKQISQCRYLFCENGGRHFSTKSSDSETLAKSVNLKEVSFLFQVLLFLFTLYLYRNLILDVLI